MTELDQEGLKQVLSFEPETGEFRWREALATHTKIGAVAGGVSRLGYRMISINGRRYMAHRLAWLYVYGEWPLQFVDHIDGNKLNNAIVNLRHASKSENGFNRSAPRTNRSGVKGVSWHGARGKWRARITANGKHKMLGYFDDKEAAAKAYAMACERIHGEFANTAGPHR